MPSDEDVTQRAGSVRAMTGFTGQELTALLPPFEHALASYLQARTIDGQPRTSHRDSRYHHCPLPATADTQRFMLTYVKQHPMQELPGQRFGMSQSKANKWIHLLHCVLNQAFPSRFASRSQGGRVSGEARRHTACRCPCVPPVWPDGTERPIHRPADPADEEDYYRGQKQCQTRNNLLVLEETCQMCFLSATSAGKATDQCLADLEG
jgi:DDE superfamily endonuclease